MAFDEFWARLCAAFPRTDLSVSTTAIYYERLKRFKADKLLAACNVIIDNCEYFPSIAEIILTIQQLPPPKPKLLLEMRPSDEEVAQARAEIKKMIDGITVKSTEKKQSIEERRAELRRQAEQLKSDSE